MGGSLTGSVFMYKMTGILLRMKNKIRQTEGSSPMATIHGSYLLDSKGNIIIARFHETWNEECSKEFFETYKSFVLNKQFREFGVLADLRQLKGATPEAVKYILKVSQWGSEHSQIARAQIIDTEFKLFTVKDLQTLDLGFPIRNFDDEKAAFRWLEKQGLKI